MTKICTILIFDAVLAGHFFRNSGRKRGIGISLQYETPSKRKVLGASNVQCFFKCGLLPEGCRSVHAEKVNHKTKEIVRT